MAVRANFRVVSLVAATGLLGLSVGFAAMAREQSEVANEAASPPAASSSTAPFATPAEAATSAYQQRTARNRAAFLDFVRLYYGERKVREAFDRYVAEDYQQHNPHIADGREAAVAWLLKMTTGSTVRMDIRRITVDGDYAVVHLHASQGPADPGHVIMNLFRLQDGIIQEHWDVTQAVPATTASGRPLG